ncbi:MAG: hypothetical protein H7Y31_10770 [Chitinophagaceae bacterium]|nr:hypothetical protein [Chitinophagaceae bacterium]
MIRQTGFSKERFAFGLILVVSACLGVSCGSGLDKQRATELIRLNYKQQNTTEGAGTWLIDSVQIHEIERVKDDTLNNYRVLAYISGLFKLPVMEDAPQGYTERFYDTLQFFARKKKEVWTAHDWTIIGARHE